jgi:hypothetical protein
MLYSPFSSSSSAEVRCWKSKFLSFKSRINYPWCFWMAVYDPMYRYQRAGRLVAYYPPAQEHFYQPPPQRCVYRPPPVEYYVPQPTQRYLYQPPPEYIYYPPAQERRFQPPPQRYIYQPPPVEYLYYPQPVKYLYYPLPQRLFSTRQVAWTRLV